MHPSTSPLSYSQNSLDRRDQNEEPNPKQWAQVWMSSEEEVRRVMGLKQYFNEKAM